MESYSDFKKYFNKNFWKCFREVTLDFNENPEKEEMLSNVYDEISKWIYAPSIPKKYLYDDKWFSVTRSIPIFEVKDYCVYYYCIRKIEHLVAINRTENTFGWWSLGGQVRALEEVEINARKESYDEHENMMAERYDVSISEYSFNPKAWRQAYWEFNEKIKATYLESSYPYVLEFDISNFYDCVRLDLLELWIREIADSSLTEIINLLFYFLNNWNRNISSYNKKNVWIPQDALADCSRLLANFYLQKYDNYVYNLCSIYWCRYLRFSDDQLIFWSHINKLHFLMFLISKKIVDFGLNINQKKVTYRSTGKFMEYRWFQLFDMLNGQEKNPDAVVEVVDAYFWLSAEQLKNMKTGWAHFLRKVAFADLSNLSDENKRKMIEQLLEIDFLKRASIDLFKRIYLILEDHKDDLVEILREASVISFHNIFHHRILIFFKDIGVEFSDIEKRINDLDVLELENGYSDTFVLEEEWFL